MYILDTFDTCSKHTHNVFVCGYVLSLVARIILKILRTHKIYVLDVDEFGIEHAVCINNIIAIGLLYFNVCVCVCGSPHRANTHMHECANIILTNRLNASKMCMYFG